MLEKIGKRMVKVSIIIPIYNVEPYLRKCLDSVCNQTLKDIEIICVNDCSPDNSLMIMKEYANRDNRIKIIDFEQNQGVAIARNKAMAQANGKYIGFVDPDDWIDLDFYEKLYNKAEELSSDLVIGNHKSVFGGKETINSYDFQIFKNEKVLYGLFPLGLYRKSLLDQYNIKFTEGYVFGEDRLLPVMSCYYAQNFDTVDDVFYYQLNRENSATKSLNVVKINNFIEIGKLVLDFLNGSNIDNVRYGLIVGSFWEGIINMFYFTDEALIYKLKSFFLFLYQNVRDKNIFSKQDNLIIESIQKDDSVSLRKNISQASRHIFMKRLRLLSSHMVK